MPVRVESSRSHAEGDARVESRQPASKWPWIAGVAGVLLAIVLTAVIWFQVIDRQATAMQRGEVIVLGTPVIPLESRLYDTVDDGERSPMP